MIEPPRKDVLEHWIAQLELSEDESALLYSQLRGVLPKHGMRAGSLNDAARFVDKAGPEQLEAYHAFRSQLPSAPAFSYLPLSVVLLVLCKVARLTYPERNLLEACNAVGRDVVEMTRNNVLTKPLFTACRGDLGTYLEAFGSSASLVTNFGAIYLDRSGPTHYTLHHERWYTFFADYTGVVGFSYGLFDVFGITDGHVELDVWDDVTYDVIMRW